MNQLATTIYPRAELRSFIESYQFFIVENNSAGIALEDYPRTAMDMVFTFDGVLNFETKKCENIALAKYTLIGLADKKYTITCTKNFTVLHVRFKANGIYPITKTPMDESWTAQISLDQLIGNDIEKLYDNMGNEPSLESKIKLLEKYLLAKYKAASIHHKFDYCLSQINNSRSIPSVAKLASFTNTNYKCLDRWFKKFVGTNPKKFLQLHRFKNVLKELETDEQVDWMSLVTDYGFHDQSHFINQFKSIADLTPTAFLQNRAASPSS